MSNTIGRTASFIGITAENLRQRDPRRALVGIANDPAIFTCSLVGVLAPVKLPDTALEYSTSLLLCGTLGGLGGSNTGLAHMQTATPTVEIKGVSNIKSLKNQLGVGKLRVEVEAAGAYLQWNGSGAGESLPISTVSNGSIELKHLGGNKLGMLKLDIELGELESGEYPIYIDNNIASVVRDITPQEAAVGVEVFSCLYLINTNPVINFSSVRIAIKKQPNSTREVYVGAAQATVNTIQPPIPNDTTAPAGVQFKTEVELGAIPSLGFKALWIKQVALPYTLYESNFDYFEVEVEGTL